MASESEALQKLKARVKFLEGQARTQELKLSGLLGRVPSPPNRWAAFTDDELERREEPA